MDIFFEEHGITGNHIFHVHTFRCGHAENVPDKAYVEIALELGASDICVHKHFLY